MKPDLFQSLIHRHLDGAATPEEASRLALALLEDPAAARAYAEATRLESGLRVCFQAEVVGRRLIESVPVSPVLWQRHSRGWLAAAAGLVVAGMSLAWWRPWARPGAGASMVVEKRTSAPPTVADVPAPPPSLRRPGALSPAAAEVKRLASRYWLPERIDFAATPLEEAVVAVQRQAGAVNHRQNATISGFAIDLPDEVTGVPVTASRANLPLAAWLELLSAQAGCELRYTDTGVAFDVVEQPDTLETRRFPLPTVAVADAPDGSAECLFSYARPWDEEPDFRSAPAHGATLAAAWGIQLPAEARAQVRDGQVLEVRHTRAVLRRIEGLLSVAAADAGRPRVTLRAKEIAVPVSSPTPAAAAVAWNDTVSGGDNYGADITLASEFEGFINYGSPIEITLDAASGQPQPVVLTESTIGQWIVATRPATGNRVVSNDEAAGMLGGALGRLFYPHATGYVAHYAKALYALGSATSQTYADGPQGTSEQPTPDPWAGAVTATVGLGESAWLAAGGAPPEIVGRDISLGLGLSLMDLQPPPPLNTTARLEGEMVKLSGTYTPPRAGGAPTDFEAYVAEGQALVLQTEDVPAVPSPGGAMAWDVEAGVARLSDEVAERYMLTRTDEAGVLAPGGVGVVNGVVGFVGDERGWQEVQPTGQNGRHGTNWAFAPRLSAPATVRGVVISPVLQWPTSAGKR